VDNLFSLFSLYDFLGYLFAGGLLLVGGYIAFEGLPAEPGAATVLVVAAASYAAGHLVATVSNLWEKFLWRRGWPAERRLDPVDPDAFGAPLRQHIDARVAQLAVAGMSSGDRFAVARADLRARGLDGRAELMNTMYGLNRGLATACWIMVVICVAAGTTQHHFGRGLAVAAAFFLCGSLYATRTARFGRRFADQVLRDFATTEPDAASNQSA
jgi:hypothetical protein